MNYRTLWNEGTGQEWTELEPVYPVAPIARHSDPTTSHKAAERIQPTVTARQLECLEVLRNYGQPMTSNELAKACCDRFCGDLKVDPVQFAKKLDNYRKRADEIKRNPELCEILEAERNGGQLFRARGSNGST